MNADREVRLQRAWARVAGLMYLLVLAVDLTGMQSHNAVLGRSLMLTGSLLTVPLALGLYFTLRPVHGVVSAFALGCRLLEALLGIISTIVGFSMMRTDLLQSSLGRAILSLAAWDHATNFAAFAFTIGSTLFFLLFVKGRLIPRPLSWLGLLASLVAMLACITHLFRPGFPAMTMTAWIPMLLAEVSTGGWLLVRSVRPAPQDAGELIN